MHARTAQVNRWGLELFRTSSVFSRHPIGGRAPPDLHLSRTALSSAGGVDAQDALRVRLGPRMPERAGPTCWSLERVAASNPEQARPDELRHGELPDPDVGELRQVPQRVRRITFSRLMRTRIFW
jgi:hypothetical protein